jgi:fluoroquinolone resistance protein
MKDGKRKHFPDAQQFVSEIFQGISADGQTLRGKLFEDCGFIGCNLADATFIDCKFVDCTFTNCNLSNMKVGGTRFSSVEFIESKVLGIDWTRATWPRVAVGAPLKFRKSILSDSTFFGLTLEEMVVEDCRAHGVDFRDANLSRGIFCRTDLRNALFGKTNLIEADFSGATDYAIDVFDNQIERARFTRDEALSLLDSLGIELVD